jgi:uncharacterized alpha-E superfamily protein
VLSRIAESLFWIGRYLERAEDTARILDVQFHLMLEDPGIDEDAAWQTLLKVMGVERDEQVVSVHSSDVCEILAYDRTTPSSIVGALSAARANARGAREVVPSEMWECLNATWYSLGPEVARATTVGPHSLFMFVKERAATLRGLIDSSLSRDDGWRFLVLGCSLERVDMTARLLSACCSATTGNAAWVTTLRSCSAHEAYLRTYQRAVDASRAAEFMLLDRLFPRSVFHALSTAETCLAELDPVTSRTGRSNEARRALGQARTHLEFARSEELLDSLPALLSRVQTSCSAASSAVAARYFRQTSAIRWTA